MRNRWFVIADYLQRHSWRYRNVLMSDTNPNPNPYPNHPSPNPNPNPNPYPNPDPNPNPNPHQVGLALLQNVSLYAQSHAELLQGGFLARIARFISSSWSASRVKVPPWQCPSSAPAPPEGAPGGSGQRGISRVRPGL